MSKGVRRQLCKGCWTVNMWLAEGEGDSGHLIQLELPWGLSPQT